MQFIDLAAQQSRISDSVHRRIETVLKHGRYILGPEVEELEQTLCAYTGAAHCVSCASGTDALLMALMAHEVGVNDAILTTPFTFVATAEVIALLGATPVFVDIDPRTYNIDPAALRATLEGLGSGKRPTPRFPENLNVRGIIAVDIFGLPADYDAIEAVAGEHGLFVIEDAAQSFGAECKGRKACTTAPTATTSFFPAKPLGCYGDGGAVFCGNRHMAEELRSLRVHGQGETKYDNVRIGINGRMDTIQAAVLLAKMEVFDEELRLRRQVAARYSEGLSGKFVTPSVPEGFASAWAQYSIQSENRDATVAELSKAGIPSAIYYRTPLHLQSAFTFLGYQRGDFPVSEEVAGRILSLPMHPYLGEEEQERIVTALT